ncbi:MAG: hypothetical protein AB7E77_10940, partial [Desulfobulbus sp.]
VLSQDQTLQFYILTNHNRLAFTNSKPIYLARSFTVQFSKINGAPQVQRIYQFTIFPNRCQPFFYSASAIPPPAIPAGEQRGANIQVHPLPVNPFLLSLYLF